jgi:hypothetical protein
MQIDLAREVEKGEGGVADKRGEVAGTNTMQQNEPIYSIDISDIV